MRPDEVDELDDDVYQAFVIHMQREAYEIQRAAKRR
jgi:hypothetical protein